MASPNRKGTAIPGLRALIQTAKTTDTTSTSSNHAEQEQTLQQVEAALQEALFPQADMRQICKEGLDTLMGMHGEKRILIARAESLGWEYMGGHPQGIELFMISKGELQRLKTDEANNFFVNILLEIAEVREVKRKIETTIVEEG